MESISIDEREIYFDIDIDFVNYIIKNDLTPLLEATNYLIDYVEGIPIKDEE